MDIQIDKFWTKFYVSSPVYWDTDWHNTFSITFYISEQLRNDSSLLLCFVSPAKNLTKPLSVFHMFLFTKVLQNEWKIDPYIKGPCLHGMELHMVALSHGSPFPWQPFPLAALPLAPLKSFQWRSTSGSHLLLLCTGTYGAYRTLQQK